MRRLHRLLGVKDCGLEPGERCAAIGVGGLAHLAIQYAAALGADVVSVTRDSRKEPMLRELGASSVVVPENGKVGQALREIEGVDAMLHTANGAEAELLEGLRPYGRLSLMSVTPTRSLRAHRTWCSANSRSRAPRKGRVRTGRIGRGALPCRPDAVASGAQ